MAPRLTYLQRFAIFATHFLAVNVISAGAVRDCRDTGGQFDYEQEVLFDENVNYYAQSLVDGGDFIITLSAAHDGFLGFGIAEQTSGSMLGADIVVAAMDDGGVRMRDYFVPYQGFPFKPFAGFVQRSPTSEPVPAGTDLRPIPDCDNGGTDGKWRLSHRRSALIVRRLGSVSSRIGYCRRRGLSDDYTQEEIGHGG